MILNINKLIRLLCNIFAYGNAYAYITYQFIWKLAYSETKWERGNTYNGERGLP